MRLFDRGRVPTGPAILASLLAVLVGACGGPEPRDPRPSTWGTPLAAEHLENLHIVSPDLYRSAQPDEEGFAEFVAMGGKSILNLREHHTDDDEAEGTALTLHHLRWDTKKVTVEQVTEALKILRDAEKPVLVHCWHGSDRTETICAAYRIVFEDWNVSEAVDEMMVGGFGHHEMFDNLPKLLRETDWAVVMRQVLPD